MKQKAYAKINLDLRVGKKNKDGYHEIKSVVSAINLFDIVKIVFSNENKLTFSNGLENNQILDIVEKIQKDHNLTKKVNVFVKKRIPIGAGLAGMSTVMATIIKMLNKMYSLNLSNEELEKYALMFGTDTVYCLDMKPAIIEGCGEKITYLEQAPFKKVALLTTKTKISTKEVYDLYKEENSTIDEFKEQVERLEKREYQDFWSDAKNDLEEISKGMDSDFEHLYNNIKERSFKTIITGSGSAMISFDLNYNPEWATSPVLETFNYYKLIGYKGLEKKKSFSNIIKKVLKKIVLP